MFYLGFPIVHNCKPFEQNGIFFDDFELLKAVELIETVRIEFDKTSYINQCKPILDEFAPTNQTRISTYKELFSRFEKISTISTSFDIETEDITDYVDENIFYQGSGYVFFLQTSEGSLNYKTLSMLYPPRKKNIILKYSYKKM